VLHDITQIRRLDEVRRDFVANVSHELKTPITAVKGYLETLLGGALEDPDSARQFTQTASKHADRLGAIVDDLLSLARLEERADALGETESCDLESVARAALDSRLAVARAKGLAVELVAPERPRVRGNPRLLEQALANLVDNAVKYTDHGGTISVRVSLEPPYAVVSVTDTGIGIPARDLKRIFERFYRVDKARRRDLGGTGLGLSVVKHIALAHGGSVEAKSVVGRGSTFTLSLPAEGGPRAG
jgi:two-component system phosphate regulon sensor histidine kinase PhoR